MPYEDLMKKYLSQGQPVKRNTPAGSRSISTEDILRGNWKPSREKSDQSIASSQQALKTAAKTIRPAAPGSRSISVDDILSGSWTPNGGTKAEPDTESSKSEYPSRKAVVDEIIGAQRKQTKEKDLQSQPTVPSLVQQAQQGRQAAIDNAMKWQQQNILDPGSRFHADEQSAGRGGKFGPKTLGATLGEIGQKSEEAKWQNEAKEYYNTAKDRGLSTEEWYDEASKRVEDLQNELDEYGNSFRKAAENAYERRFGGSEAHSGDGFSGGRGKFGVRGKEDVEHDLEAAKKELEYATALRWSDAMNDPEYDAKVASGRADKRNMLAKAVAEKESGRLTGDYINPESGEYEYWNPEKSEITPDLLYADDYLTDDEKDLYCYLLVERGEETANNYLKEMATTVDVRLARQMADDIKNDPWALRLIETLALDVTTGLGNAAQGVRQNFSDEAVGQGPLMYAGSFVRQDLEDTGPKIFGRSALGLGYDAVNTISNMAPSLVAGTVNPVLGAGLMSVQAKGNAYTDALNKGYSKTQARDYSNIVGVAEGTLQYLLGGISKFGGISQFTGKMTSKIGSTALRAGAELGIDIFGENLEEYLQNKIALAAANTILGENNEIKLWDDDDAYTLMLTTLTTGLLNSGEVINTARYGKVGKQFMKDNGRMNSLLDAASQSTNQEVRSLAESIKSGETKATPVNIGALAVAFEHYGGNTSFVVEDGAIVDEEATDAYRQATDEQNAETELTEQKKTEIISGEEFKTAGTVLEEDAKAIQAVYNEGQDLNNYEAAMNAGINLLAAEGTNREALDKSNLTSYLTKEQRDIAWEIGHAKYEARQQQAAEQSRKGAEREVSDIRPGRVSYDKATIGGVEYQAADPKRMNQTQKQQVEASAIVAKALGLELTVFDGVQTEKAGDINGAYVSGGKIFLNANAGKAVGETLIISTMSHEITHFAEQYGGKSYQELRSFVVQTLADGNMTKFEQIVEAKRQSRGGISYEEAVSEVVADGCETMLRDTHAMERLAYEHPTLMRKIGSWINNMVKKLRAAFNGVSARHEEARVLLEHAEELQRLFDNALAEAVQNRENERTEEENAHSEEDNARSEKKSDRSEKENAHTEKKTTAEEDGGRVQYSLDGKNEYGEEVYKTSESLEGLSYSEKLEIFKANFYLPGSPQYLGKKIRFETKSGMYYAEIDRQTQRENIKKINPRQLNQSDKAKINIGASGDFVTLLENAQIDKENVPLKGNNNEAKKNALSFDYFLKNVEVDGKRFKVIINIRNTTSGKYVYEVKLNPIKKNSSFGSQQGETQRQPARKNPLHRSSGDNVSQNVDTVKGQHSEMDGVSDRALLREAAELEGASEELQKYARKADNLEDYQKRLERQQKKLAEGNLGTEEKAALEKRIAETEELIGRTQDALTRMELRPSMQQEIQEARERWWAENIPDAVETSRQIQRENRELRQAVQYYREQAQHTSPENRSVDKADVRRFARSLLKEHESSADVDQLSRQIETLGRKLVQGTGEDLNSHELNSIARGAARMIVDETYRNMNTETSEELSGLSARVRGTRLQISDELRGDIPDFNAWRKANLGRFTLVNEGGASIDEFYQTLRDDYGEGYFPASITSASNQIEQIDRMLNAAKPRYQYAFTEMQREENVSLVAQEIMDTILSGEIREAETIADRNYRAMEQRMLQAREAQRKAQNEAARANRRADNAEKTALREAKEELKAINREKVKQLRRELNEGREARQKRINIERQRARLSRMLQENSAKNHVPEALRSSIGRFIQSLDTLGPFSEGSKSEAKFRAEMQDLASALRGVKDSSELNDFYGDLELTEGVKAMLQNNIEDVEAAIAGNEGTVTRKMNLEQLRKLEETLTVLSTAVKNVNALLSDGEHRFAHMDELGEESIRENYKIAEKKSPDGTVGKQLKWANLTPFYAFKRYGEAGREIFRGLTRGWGRMARHIDQVQRYAEETYTAEEVKNWEKTEHSFKLVPRMISDNSQSAVKSGSMDLKADAVDVTMTEAQIMSLYCLNKREQARGHLYGAGIRIGDYKIGIRRPKTQSEHYLLDLDDMATILKTLSPRQIEVCDKLTEYMNTVGSSWGNEVSMKLYGIRGFTEENYFPIRTDSTQHKAKTADSERGNLFRLANQSFTKQLTKNANNAIIVDSVFDVFSDHMADMAKYNAMVLPMLDAMRWYNYQSENTSVQQALQRAFGSEAGRYFKDFMQDLNGAGEGGRGEQWYSKLTSGVKVASVGANIRVALQQPTSIARAALLIDPKYLAEGAMIKGGRAKALQYSGLAVWKDLGYFDVNVNRGMREQIKHADTLKQKIQDKSLWLAEKGDQMTWGALWNACELETKSKTGLTGEELMQKTAERFDEVILATQVMDSTLTRSSNMRSKSALMKEFTAFMAEPTLTYNMLLDVASEFDKIKRTKGTSEAAKQMKGQILRTAAVYCASAALTAVAQAVGDAGRDDDDYETWLQKFTQHWSEDFLDNLNPMKLVPIVQDLYKIVFEDRDKELMVLQPLRQGKQVWDIWAESYRIATGKQDKATSTTWYGNMTTYGKIYKTLQFLSSTTGLPMGAATREFQSGYNTLLRPLLNETWGKASGKELPKWRTYDGGPKRQIQSAWGSGYLSDEEAKALLIEEDVAMDETEAGKIIYKWGIDGAAAYKAVKEAAVKGDEKAYSEAMKAMTDAGYTEKDVQSEVKSAIKEQYLQPESGLELSKAYCIDYLQRFAGMSKADAEAETQKWTCYKVTGIAYEDIKAEYVAGNISERRARELRVTYGGFTDEDAAEDVRKWACERDTGIAYDEVRKSFLNGEISESQARTMRVKYGGESQEDAEKTVRSWACEKDCGFKPSELAKAYRDGSISRSKASQLMQKYGAKSADEAEDELMKQDFIKACPAAENITVSAVKSYSLEPKAAGVSEKTYFEFWNATKDMKSDKDANGKEIKGRAKKDKVVAYINGMKISREQKDALYLSMYESKYLRNAPWNQY